MLLPNTVTRSILKNNDLYNYSTCYETWLTPGGSMCNKLNTVLLCTFTEPVLKYSHRSCTGSIMLPFERIVRRKFKGGVKSE